MKKAKRQFINEKCLENHTQSCSLWFILFSASFFYYHYIVLIHRSSLDDWLRIYMLFFSLNQCHSFASALEKLCEAQNPMKIMKVFLMFICNCIISTIAYVIKLKALVQGRERCDISLKESRIH